MNADPSSSTTEFAQLMEHLSIPRPNGSPSERSAGQFIKAWAASHGIHYQVHAFRVLPYFFECIGIWLIVSRTLLAAALFLRWGWAALIIALVGLAGGLLDVAFNLPVISWIGARRAENIFLKYDAPQPRQEVILSAHYDSKTELLDHRQRMFFLVNLRTGIVLTVLLGLMGAIQPWVSLRSPAWGTAFYLLSLGLSVIMLALAWGLGLNLSTGRLLKPSSGAVDNGAACAILLDLGARLARGELALDHTQVTLALFTGEEVNMQGSRAYLRQRKWSLPAAAVNLEVMAQDGEYVLWEQDGSVFDLRPTDPHLNAVLKAAVHDITGLSTRMAGPVTSDGGSLIRAGLPTAVLGTYDQRWVDTGFHSPADNLQRVKLERLPEGVEILSLFLRQVDCGKAVGVFQPLKSSHGEPA
jgi:hypothetical protein